MLKSLIAQLLTTQASKQPDIPALINETRTLDYLQLSRLVTFWETRINFLELPSGVCIGLRFTDQLEYLICHLALLKLGITQTALAPDDNTSVQQKDTLSLQVDLIITDSTGSENLFSCPVITAITGLEALRGQVKAMPKDYPVDTCLLFQGSGTTAQPKLIAIPDHIYAAMLEDGLPYNQAQSGEKYYCCTRVHYSFARRMALMYLLKGATLLLPNQRPKDLLKFCLQEEVAHLLLTADQARAFLLDHPKARLALLSAEPQQLLTGIKSLTLSSSLIKEDLRVAIMKALTPNLFIHYGCNEFGMISQADPEEIRSTPGTVGKIIPSVELKLVPLHSHETKSEFAQGSVAVKRARMITSYVGNREDTRRNFSPSGFFHPQDIGRLTQDGQLIIEGRADDAILFSGVTLYPRPLEVVLELHPSVAEAAVFPVTLGDRRIPVAVVTTIETTNQSTLLQHCEHHLGWRRPQLILLAQKLPRNPAGKVLKRVLAQHVQDQLSQASPERNSNKALS